MGTCELSRKPDEMLGDNLAMDYHRIQGGVVILLVASLHGNQDKLQLGGPIRWIQTLLLIKYEESSKMNTCSCCSQLHKHYSWLLMIRTFQNTIVFFFLVRCLFEKRKDIVRRNQLSIWIWQNTCSLSNVSFKSARFPILKKTTTPG